MARSSAKGAYHERQNEKEENLNNPEQFLRGAPLSNAAPAVRTAATQGHHARYVPGVASGRVLDGPGNLQGNGGGAERADEPKE